jgi:AcrR family transcriptional regulator
MMERREEIIMAALELASENGLKSVSMSRIAEKVQIKAPSLYNHFKSKDEIVKAMYTFLREKAQQNRSTGFADPEDYKQKTLEQILTECLNAYLSMIMDPNMMLFFRVLYSERSINPLAAEIMLEETEHMIRSTRNLFYALAVHGKMKSESIDTAAMTFALTVHSLIDYRMDRITAGVTDQFDDGEKPYTKELADFVKWFSTEIGGDCHEKKTH